MKKPLIITLALVSIAILVIAWFLVSPLFLNKMVVEEFPETMTETEQELLLSGEFVDADDFHKGSGSAEIYALEDGSKLLRFEDFDVTNGPDLRVMLAEHPEPKTRDQLKSGAYVELAKLKGNRGDQNYIIPADINLNDYGSVLIYCKPFHVVFTTATLN